MEEKERAPPRSVAITTTEQRSFKKSKCVDYPLRLDSQRLVRQMSRGFGALQRDILSWLAAAGQQPGCLFSSGRICWELGEDMRRVAVGDPIGKSGLREGELDMAHYKSFRRALMRLEKDGAVLVSRRKLETVEEVAEHFPYKTRRLDVKELRRFVFQALARHFEEAPGRFQNVEVERRLIDEMHSSRSEDALRCEREWASIEDRLWSICLDPAKRRQLFQLIHRGHVYFVRGAAPHGQPFSQSFASLIRGCVDILPPDVVERLRALYGCAFPPSQRRHAVTKGKLFDLADFGRNQKRVALNDDALKMILETSSDVVRSLPGFKDPAGPQVVGRVGGQWQTVSGWTFPPLLVQALDRHVFEEFEFLALPESRPLSSHAIG